MYFLTALLHHFFNTGRVNSTVYYQFFQGNPCHFSTNRIESGKYNCLRSIINNQFYTGKLLQCANISSLSSDNSSLHLIVWKLHYGNRRFRHLISSTALNSFHNIFSSGFLSLFLSSCLILSNKQSCIMLNTVFHRVKQFLFCLILR